MKKLLLSVSLATILAGLLLFEVSDTEATTPNNKVVNEVCEANNPSASATITITMTPVYLPGEE